MAEGNGVKTKVSLAVLKEKVDNLEVNHLPHIYKSLEDLRTEVGNMKVQISYWGGGLAALILALSIVTNFLR